MMDALDTQGLLGVAQARAQSLPATAKALAAGQQSRAQIERTAEAFEAQFLAQMLAPMFEGLESGGLFGGGQSETLYRSLLVDEYGKVLARAGGIGIADTLTQEMLKLQEATS